MMKSISALMISVFSILMVVSCSNTITEVSQQDNLKTVESKYISPKPEVIYVSTTGNDTINTGTTVNDPVQSIRQALLLVRPTGRILVASGIYYITNNSKINLTNNNDHYGVQIIGAYSDAFYTTRNLSSPSVLQGANGANRILFVSNVNNFSFDGFDLRGIANTGAVTLYNVNNARFQNMKIYNLNYAYAFSISKSALNLIEADIANVNARGGAAYQIDNSHGNIFRGTVNGNTSTYANVITANGCNSNEFYINATGNMGLSGVYGMSGCTNNLIKGVLQNNTATANGGAISFSGTAENRIEANIIGNTTPRSGGAIYVTNSFRDEFVGTISGNSASYYGGGIYAVNCKLFSVNGSVSANTLNALNWGYSTCGGGVYLLNSESCTFYGSFDHNTVGGNGGGLYIENSTNVVIDGTFTGNRLTSTAPFAIYFSGGAVYSYKGKNITITGSDMSYNTGVACLELIDTENLIINGNTFAQNGTNQSITYAIRLNNAGNMNSLNVSGNTFSGSTTPSGTGIENIAVYETGDIDVANHVFQNNNFRKYNPSDPLSITYYYHDKYTGIDIRTINYLNQTGINYFGASIANGNNEF